MSYEGPHPIPVKSGGSGSASLTGVLTGNGTTPFTTSAITQYNVLVAGASNLISSIAPPVTSGIALIGQGAASNPAFGTVVVAGGGTGATSLTAHSVLIGNGTSAIVQVGPVAATGALLSSNGVGSDPGFTTATYPLTTTINQLLYSSAANTITGLTTANNGLLVTSNTGVPSILAGPGTTGNVLQSNAAAAPSFSTATYPSTAGSTGKILISDGTNIVSSTPTYPNAATGTGTILRADGTNWVATTATYPTTTTSQQILYSTAANVIGQLTTANSSLPATNSSGTLAMRAFSVNIQVFTSDGTYTPTSGMLYCVMECVGGGGGGGGTDTAAAATLSGGGGGGGGAYSRKFASASTVGASQTVTIGAAGTAGASGNNAGGAGGATSVGTICTANGGSGGAGSSGSTSSAGGAGGTAGTGDFSVPGEAGFFFLASTAVAHIGIAGKGGASGCGFGYGGANNSSTVPLTGVAGQNYGGGGSGGQSFNAAGAAAGGAGVKGLVVVTEYVIA